MGTPVRGGRFNGRKSGSGEYAGRSSSSSKSSESSGRRGRGATDHPILFQDYFKSVGPRTYAAQVKKAGNGNHYLVLTEGKRDDGTGEVRKTKLFLFSEDFPAFFRMMKAASEFIKSNPVPAEVAAERKAFWARGGADARAPKAKTSPEQARPASRPPSPPPAAQRVVRTAQAPTAKAAPAPAARRGPEAGHAVHRPRLPSLANAGSPV